MIHAEGLSFTYATQSEPALSGIGLRVSAGEAVGIIGCDGSGKSTLLQVLAGLAPRLVKGSRQGSLCIAGLDPAKAETAARMRTVGLVFSDPASQLTGVCPTVEEEIAWSLENIGESRQAMHRKAEDLIGRLHLEHIRFRTPHTLSSGQQQLVAIASVLILKPKVLLFDEPATRLDAASRRAVADLAKQLAREGHTVLWSSSSLEDVDGFSRWIYLERGQILYDGAPRHVGGQAWPAPWTRLAQAAKEAGKWPGPMPLREADAAEELRKMSAAARQLSP